ncbi:MAG: Deoxyguanosinetriphosphate triphosphohydrolase [Bacteroidetes bacterium ADurb.BinA174]|nr:MAG: Deoxyguanosinetriphosphate triphosphohydrolase [Bacteroidetes bacterium ADurb.BinA174]
MEGGIFTKEKIHPGHQKWDVAISRQKPLYERESDIRSAFSRDYNRIIHCTAYRRLKHKTQVFFATSNDHICTRIEHVNHVTSISQTIATYLGLNTELTMAMAMGHDIGHAPFGHQGETILKEISQKELGKSFWHEKNSLRFVDKCETLEDPNGKDKNLNLTYAVRDGIICHCGEVDDLAIFPRKTVIDLESIEEPGKTQPYTWEACVVKIADKIAYLGRDIEDARTLKIIERSDLVMLIDTLKNLIKSKNISRKINNTILIHDFIINLCQHSSLKKGIKISPDRLEIMRALRKFNYDNIYNHSRLDNFKKYSELILKSIYNKLRSFYKGIDTIKELERYKENDMYLITLPLFSEWIKKYCKNSSIFTRIKKYENEALYDLENEKDYYQAVIDFIAGMTDSFAIKVFDDISMF